MKTTTIQLANLEDLPLVREIAYATWPSAYGHSHSKEQLDYMLNQMYSLDALAHQHLDQRHIFLIACEEDDARGFASLELNFEHSNECKLHKLYVVPQNQNSGLGLLLLNACLDLAKKACNKSLILNVNKHNNARQWYESNGFNVYKEDVIDIGSGFVMDDYLMRKEIID